MVLIPEAGADIDDGERGRDEAGGEEEEGAVVVGVGGEVGGGGGGDEDEEEGVGGDEGLGEGVGEGELAHGGAECSAAAGGPYGDRCWREGGI